jgi:hypothetical protein
MEWNMTEREFLYELFCVSPAISEWAIEEMNKGATMQDVRDRLAKVLDATNRE